MKLKDQREHLAKEVLDFVNQHIIEVDPRYEDERILFSKETGESEKNILINRNLKKRVSMDGQNELKLIFS
jgi:hypothetical protein